MTRLQYLGLVAIIGAGLLVLGAVQSKAQRPAGAVPGAPGAPRVAFGGSGADILHMGPYVEIKGLAEAPVLNSDQHHLFRFYNDGEQAVMIFGGAGMKTELARIEPGKFHFVGDKNLKIVGTEKEKSTTVFVVYQK